MGGDILVQLEVDPKDFVFGKTGVDILVKLDVALDYIITRMLAAKMLYPSKIYSMEVPKLTFIVYEERVVLKTEYIEFGSDVDEDFFESPPSNILELESLITAKYNSKDISREDYKTVNTYNEVTNKLISFRGFRYIVEAHVATLIRDGLTLRSKNSGFDVQKEFYETIFRNKLGR